MLRQFISTKVIILFCLIYFELSNLRPAHSDSVQNFYIQQALQRYFPLPSDARSIATGASTDMNCFGAICTFLNPAGLGSLSNYEASAAVSTESVNGSEFITNQIIEQTEQSGYVLLAVPLGEIKNEMPRFGNIVGGYSRYQGKTDDTISSTPDGHRRSIAYGYSVNQRLAFGYSFTFYDDQLNSRLADIHSHGRILHLFGSQFKISDRTNIGVAFKFGLGQSDTEDYIRESDGLSKPRQYSGLMGISSKLENFILSFGADYSHYKSSGNLIDVSPEVVIGSSEEGNSFALRSGLEYSFSQDLTTRAGLRWYEVLDYEFSRAELKELSGGIRGVGLSAGIGYEFTRLELKESGIRIEYGFDYLTATNGDWTQIISVSVPFGGSEAN